MSRPAEIVLFAAVFLRFTSSAADCHTDSCIAEDDETQLVQVDVGLLLDHRLGSMDTAETQKKTKETILPEPWSKCTEVEEFGLECVNINIEVPGPLDLHKNLWVTEYNYEIDDLSVVTIGGRSDVTPSSAEYGMRDLTFDNFFVHLKGKMDDSAGAVARMKQAREDKEEDEEDAKKIKKTEEKYGQWGKKLSTRKERKFRAFKRKFEKKKKAQIRKRRAKAKKSGNQRDVIIGFAVAKLNLAPGQCTFKGTEGLNYQLWECNEGKCAAPKAGVVSCDDQPRPSPFISGAKKWMIKTFMSEAYITKILCDAASFKR